jgi:hypothetical protein
MSIKFDCDKNQDYDFTKSSMAENREFLYNLVCELKPQTIVELGTYYGCSYFAFAQAIKDKGLYTQLVGVDTWQGDIHTGKYDDAVFESFLKIKQDTFKGGLHFQYLRSTFKAAVDMFDDNSIDILMIDGTHTAEAAREDYLNYLPKLKENAIVLFHDTKVNRFTLKEFWEKISSKHISYNFDNRFGLGVLAPKGIDNFAKIRHLFKLPKTLIYTAIYGGRDDLKAQVFQTYPVQQIAFTDQDLPAKYKGWDSKFTQVHADSLRAEESRMKAKFIKVCSSNDEWLSGCLEADYLIWIDGSIKIKNTKFVEMMVKACGDNMVAFLPHPDRNCIYKEYDACIEAGRIKTDEEKQLAIDQLIRYKKDRFMPEMGLLAGTVFIRNMNHPRIKEFNRLWWEEIINGSHRDQLSLPYVLWKMNEKPAIVNLNLWSNEYFSYGKHTK